MAGADPSRGGSWRPILLLVTLAPLLLGLMLLLRAGGGLRVEPGVDWSAYPPSVHDAVDHAAKNADCAGLAEQRAWATAADSATLDAEPLIDYIDAIRRQFVCPS